jgi:hypothetical protein
MHGRAVANMLFLLHEQMITKTIQSIAEDILCNDTSSLFTRLIPILSGISKLTLEQEALSVTAKVGKQRTVLLEKDGQLFVGLCAKRPRSVLVLNGILFVDALQLELENVG